jgi:cation:H+ antiporter
MTLLTIGLLIGGLAILTFGADLLVRGATALAIVVGISPLVVGLTVVAYGTSTPELAVSISAGLKGNSDIAVANVIGSNTFNVLFILGACALLAPLTVSRQLVRFDVPLMIGVTVLAVALGLDGKYGIFDGIVLTAGIIAYTAFSIIKSRRDERAQKLASGQVANEAEKPTRTNILKDIGLVAAGLVLLVIGSRWFVQGAIEVAKVLGVSDTVIGLTIVAAGTSLPEVATSIVATIKGQRDIAIGNVVGSNIYNILGILGVASLVTPGGLTVASSTIAVDLPVMLAVAAVCLPVFMTRFTIDRWEGALLFTSYVVYVAYLVLSAVGSPQLATFVSAVTWGFLPVSAGAVLLSVIAGKRSQSGAT